MYELEDRCPMVNKVVFAEKKESERRVALRPGRRAFDLSVCYLLQGLALSKLKVERDEG